MLAVNRYQCLYPIRHRAEKGEYFWLGDGFYNTATQKLTSSATA